MSNSTLWTTTISAWLFRQVLYSGQMLRLQLSHRRN